MSAENIKLLSEQIESAFLESGFEVIEDYVSKVYKRVCELLNPNLPLRPTGDLQSLDLEGGSEDYNLEILCNNAVRVIVQSQGRKGIRYTASQIFHRICVNLDVDSDVAVFGASKITEEERAGMREVLERLGFTRDNFGTQIYGGETMGNKQELFSALKEVFGGIRRMEEIFFGRKTQTLHWQTRGIDRPTQETVAKWKKVLFALAYPEQS